MIIYKGAAHYRGWYTELEDSEGDADVKRAWCGTDIQPFNSDAAFISFLDSYKRSAPLLPSTPQSYKLLNTSHNRRDLRQ